MKKTLLMLSAIIVLMTAIVFGTISADAAKKGALTYEIQNGEAIIMSCDSSYSGVLEIPETLSGYPVTRIEYGSFWNCTKITKIIFPKSITYIDGGAFNYCESLINVTVNEGNEYYSIVDGVLFSKDKTELIYRPAGKTETEYTVPSGVEKICSYSFTCNYNLVTVNLPDTLEIIEDSAFYECGGLESIDIPEGVKSIGMSAFALCFALKNATIPQSVTEIGSHAFSSTAIYFNEDNWENDGLYIDNCLVAVKDDIRSVYLINRDTRLIADGIFAMANDITNIQIDESNSYYTTINGVLFDKDVTMLIKYPAGKKATAYTVPDTVKVISDEAFSCSNNLVSVTLPEGLIEIGNASFAGMENLESINLPDTLERIGDSAFTESKKLDNIVFPDSLKYLSGYSFSNTGLTQITFPNNIDYVPAAAFMCTKIETLEIPNHISVIEDSAFLGCFNLESIVLSKGVKEIESYAFYMCDALKDVYYTGTSDEWDAIFVGEENDNFTNATIHFNYQPVKKNGWQLEDNTWYFYENGIKVKNDWRIDSTGWCFLDEEGKWVTNGLVQDSVGLAYVTDDGYFYYNTTGWKIVNGEWYYIENGYAVTNQWRADSQGWCYLSETGAMVTNDFVNDSTGSAYITEDGYFYYNVTGWKLVNDEWYYVENGYAVKNEWRADSIGWCYLSETGAMVTNNFVNDSVGKAYITEDGYFYYTENGWRLIGDTWYFIENGYAVMNQWRLDSIGWCYLGEDGAMLTNVWLKDSTGWCWLDESGYWDGVYYDAPQAA